MACGEFDLIARFFKRSHLQRQDVLLGVGDDCALLTVPEHQTLAVSTDTLVEKIHFLPAIDPVDLAYKSLAVNVSDLAAMGATPAWLSLALTLPTANETWLQAYSDTLFEQLDYYGMQLIGGDTTHGPLSLTLTVFGMIPQGRALTRSGAQSGDWVFVTGTPGDSAAGLAVLQDRIQVMDEAQRDYLVQRHLRPQPRVLVGQGLRDIASAAIDISDGLLADLGHILKASGCGARIELQQLPLSPALRQTGTPEQQRYWALAGGEDYELCFTVPESHRGALQLALKHIGVEYTCIGQLTAQSGEVMLLDHGQPVIIETQGFDHFRSRGE